MCYERPYTTCRVRRFLWLVRQQLKHRGLSREPMRYVLETVCGCAIITFQLVYVTVTFGRWFP